MQSRNNNGYSLVEIIIVIAIMSVMIGVIGYGLSFVSGKPAEECAQKLTSTIQHTRTVTMGKNATCIVISTTPDGIKASEQITQITIESDGTYSSQIVTNDKIVGSKSVKIEYRTKDHPEYTELTSQIMLEFDRGSGALKPIRLEDGTYGSDYYMSLRISKASTTKYIIIAPLTGRVMVSDTDS